MAQDTQGRIGRRKFSLIPAQRSPTSGSVVPDSEGWGSGLDLLCLGAFASPPSPHCQPLVLLQEGEERPAMSWVPVLASVAHPMDSGPGMICIQEPGLHGGEPSNLPLVALAFGTQVQVHLIGG